MRAWICMINVQLDLLWIHCWFSSSGYWWIPIIDLLPELDAFMLLWFGMFPPFILLRIGINSITLFFWLMISFFSYTHLPLYAASESGKQLDAASESSKLDAPSSEGKGFIATRLNQIKHWLLSHSQHMNFFTILVLASVSLDLLWFYHLITL